MTTQTETPVPEKFWPGPEEGTWSAYGVDIPETGWQCRSRINDGWYRPLRVGKRPTGWLENIYIVRPYLNSPRKHALADNTVTTTGEAGRLDPETWEFASTDGSGWVSVIQLPLDFPDIPVVVRQKPAPATTTVFETPAAKLIKEFRDSEKTEDTVMTFWTSWDGVHNLMSSRTAGTLHYSLQVKTSTEPDDYNNVPVHVEVPHDLTS